MHAPYDDTMDCMTISKDSDPKDSVVLIEAEDDDGKALADPDEYPEDEESQSWESANGNAAETCASNVCTLVYSFKRGFETDTEGDLDNTAPVEDYQIDPEQIIHVDAVAFIRKTSGGTVTRQLSDANSIFLRSPAVEVGEPKRKNKAEWSIFFIIAFCIVLYYTIRVYNKCQKSIALRQVKTKEKLEKAKRDAELKE